MLISGFSFTHNATQLYLPVVESIQSILPLIDEFVIVVCDGDGNDNTYARIASMGDDKIRIINKPWPKREEAGEHIYSHVTNQALEQCRGTWCFYLQSDEVIHENDLAAIRQRCEAAADNPGVEAMLFDYLHFWGDYHHYQKGHGWYRKEIRIIRNGIGLRSKGDAQSFRFAGGRKAVVAHSGARVFHYGHTRPPHVMKTKERLAEHIYHGKNTEIDEAPDFDYGPLGKLCIFEGSHPAVMQKRIQAMDWGDKLRDTDPPNMQRQRHKHERFKYRFLSKLEKLTGLDLNHKNYSRILKT